MFGATKFVAVTAAALLLAGCASAPAVPPVPPLTAKMATVSLAALADPNLLVGDSVPLSATVELDGKRKDAVTLLVESSADGVTWTTVDKVKAKGPKVELAASLVTGVAGPQQFRASVTSGKKAKPLASSDAQTATVSDIQQLVRRFYYDGSQAFQTSTAAGIAFHEAHNYPGFADMKSAAWKAQQKNNADGELTLQTVPVLTTVSPDPTWTLTKGECNAAFPTPPKGRTFIVSVDQTAVFNGFSDTSKADVHVTFLDGKLFHWMACS